MPDGHAGLSCSVFGGIGDESCRPKVGKGVAKSGARGGAAVPQAVRRGE